MYSAQKKMEEDLEVNNAEQNLKIVKISNILNKIATNVFSEGKDIIAFVGPTKAGKSTLINCLMNCPLIGRKDPRTEDTFIVALGATGPVIGIKGESETSVPKNYANLPGTDWPMWDFAGFGDNKGTVQEIANAAAYLKVLLPQRSVRFVLVVPIELIKTADPMRFFQLLSDISQICPNISENLCIVATKSEKGNISAWLEDAMSTSFNNASKENLKIINDAKSIIKVIIKEKRCMDFKAPIIGDGILEQPFLLPNQKEIISLMRTIKGTKVSEFPLVISDKAKHEILELYTHFFDNLRSTIENHCDQLDRYFQKNINLVLEAQDDDGQPCNSAAKLTFFKKGRENISDVLETAHDFPSFFTEIKKFGFHVDDIKNSVEYFSLVENLKNLYKLERDEDRMGKEIFFKRILITLNSIVSKYSDLIVNSEVATAQEKELEEMMRKEHEQNVEQLKNQLADMEARNEMENLRLEEFERDNRELKAELNNLQNESERKNEKMIEEMKLLSKESELYRMQIEQEREEHEERERQRELQWETTQKEWELERQRDREEQVDREWQRDIEVKRKMAEMESEMERDRNEHKQREAELAMRFEMQAERERREAERERREVEWGMQEREQSRQNDNFLMSMLFMNAMNSSANTPTYIPIQTDSHSRKSRSHRSKR